MERVDREGKREKKRRERWIVGGNRRVREWD